MHLAVQLEADEHDLLGNALEGEQVDVLELVFVVLVAIHLDPTLVHQGFEVTVLPPTLMLRWVRSGFSCRMRITLK